MKCTRNDVELKTIISDETKEEKLQALIKINKYYQLYKEKNNLVDISDIESSVLNCFDTDIISFIKDFNNIYIDNFSIDNISFVKSKKQKNILEKLNKFKKPY